MVAETARAAEPPDAPPHAPLPVPVTSLTIQVVGSPAEMTVMLDGLPIAAPPGERVAVRPGPHRIEVSAPGYFTEGRDVRVAPAQNLNVRFELTSKVKSAGVIAERAEAELERADAEPLHPQLVAGVAIAVLGCLSAIASGIAFAVYEDDRREVRRLIETGRCREEGDATVCASEEDSDKVDQLDDESYQLLLSTVALGAGAVFLAITGVALAVTVPAGSASRTVRLAPMLGAGLYGAQLRYLW